MGCMAKRDRKWRTLSPMFSSRVAPFSSVWLAMLPCADICLVHGDGSANHVVRTPMQDYVGMRQCGGVVETRQPLTSDGLNTLYPSPLTQPENGQSHLYLDPTHSADKPTVPHGRSRGVRCWGVQPCSRLFGLCRRSSLAVRQRLCRIQEAAVLVHVVGVPLSWGGPCSDTQQTRLHLCVWPTSAQLKSSHCTGLAVDIM